MKITAANPSQLAFFERDHTGRAAGAIDETHLTDQVTRRSKGIGVVEMSSDEEANATARALDGSTLDGRPMTVEEIKIWLAADHWLPAGDWAGPSHYVATA